MPQCGGTGKYDSCVNLAARCQIGVGSELDADLHAGLGSRRGTACAAGGPDKAVALRRGDHVGGSLLTFGASGHLIVLRLCEVGQHSRKANLSVIGGRNRFREDHPPIHHHYGDVGELGTWWIIDGR
jgi:hypothetical protein